MGVGRGSGVKFTGEANAYPVDDCIDESENDEGLAVTVYPEDDCIHESENDERLLSVGKDVRELLDSVGDGRGGVLNLLSGTVIVLGPDLVVITVRRTGDCPRRLFGFLSLNVLHCPDPIITLSLNARSKSKCRLFFDPSVGGKVKKFHPWPCVRH